jgi:hypothetical protein
MDFSELICFIIIGILVIIEYLGLFWLFYKCYTYCFKTNNKSQNIAIRGFVVHKGSNNSNNDNKLCESPNNNPESSDRNVIINSLKRSDENHEMQIIIREAKFANLLEPINCTNDITSRF